ncbi:MAG TPA: class I SAM-dependent methyltransferase [Terrimicrobiaceae bacterium]
MLVESEYTESFYRSKRDGALRSAREIVPIIVAFAKPRSVIDIGCGSGCWLAVFHEHGVAEFLGVDGSHVDRSMLEIPEERFLSFDLSHPLKLDRRYDLVVSLEVAEHLPPESAEAFVDSLTTLGPVILFSAAIPFQKGTGHLNEQWPEYWVERFACRNFVVADAIRRRVWNNERIEFWYIQNTLVFIHRDFLDNFPALREESEQTDRSCLSLVHPRLFSSAAEAELEQREKAEFYIAESARLEHENQIHGDKAMSYMEEITQLKADVQMHRERAESYIAEATRLEHENQIQLDKILSYESEVAQLTTDLHVCREKVERYFRASDLPNLPLHHLLAALPVNIRRTLTGTKKRPA